jgi:hypothetical protein
MGKQLSSAYITVTEVYGLLQQLYRLPIVSLGFGVVGGKYDSGGLSGMAKPFFKKLTVWQNLQQRLNGLHFINPIFYFDLKLYVQYKQF